MVKYMTEADWKNSKYFRKEEFRCGCRGKYCNGYPSEIAKSLVDTMNTIRTKYGKSITITSGLRCKTYNGLVGGVSNSKHLYGLACDWNFTNQLLLKEQKANIIKYIKTLPNISYTYTNQSNMYNAIHVDTLLVEDSKKYPGTYPKLPEKGYLQCNDRGLQVKNLQKFLNWCISANLEVDGSFGPLTLEAVIKYQETYGLEADGFFGPKSLAKAKTIKK